jgi:hypothetical protein
MNSNRWRPSREVWSDEAMTFTDDWTFTGADGKPLARM